MDYILYNKIDNFIYSSLLYFTKYFETIFIYFLTEIKKIDSSFIYKSLYFCLYYPNTTQIVIFRFLHFHQLCHHLRLLNKEETYIFIFDNFS
jgi:hypothetical protein